jgi:hypothetical protein
VAVPPANAEPAIKKMRKTLNNSPKDANLFIVPLLFQ